MSMRQYIICDFMSSDNLSPALQYSRMASTVTVYEDVRFVLVALGVDALVLHRK